VARAVFREANVKDVGREVEFPLAAFRAANTDAVGQQPVIVNRAQPDRRSQRAANPVGELGGRNRAQG
jgi:hypothetical protein